jgi:hypothetical protein
MGWGSVEARRARLKFNQWSINSFSKLEAFKKDKLLVQQSIEHSFARYHEYANNLREALGMAKKDFQSNTWKAFVNVTLTPEHKEALDAWDVADGGVFEGLAVYGERGYKLSVTYSKQSDSWNASYTGMEGCGKNAGYTVSAFAPSPYEAMRVLLFKVATILPDEWTDYKNTGGALIG